MKARKQKHSVIVLKNVSHYSLESALYVCTSIPESTVEIQRGEMSQRRGLHYNIIITAPTVSHQIISEFRKQFSYLKRLDRIVYNDEEPVSSVSVSKK